MSSTKTQDVYRIVTPNGYQTIKCFKEPVPECVDKNEILVKIKAVSLNYRDLVIASDRYPLPQKDQVVPCSDGAGEVVQVGSSVQDFQVGDRVVACFDPSNLYGPVKNWNAAYGAMQDGMLCQYKVFSSQDVVKLSADNHLSYEEAASLVCTGTTAWNSLYGGGERFTAGQTVLLLGTGGVSIAALVLAKAAGAITIITSSSDEKLKYVQENYGADHVVNYKTHPDWEKQVLDITHGEGVDFVIENGGNGTIAKFIGSLKMGGLVALVGYLTQVDPTKLPDMLMITLTKGAHVRGITVDSKQMFEELLRFVHAKKLRISVESVFDFTDEQIHLAYKNVESQSKIGKTVIKLN